MPIFFFQHHLALSKLAINSNPGVSEVKHNRHEGISKKGKRQTSTFLASIMMNTTNTLFIYHLIQKQIRRQWLRSPTDYRILVDTLRRVQNSGPLVTNLQKFAKDNKLPVPYSTLCKYFPNGNTKRFNIPIFIGPSSKIITSNEYDMTLSDCVLGSLACNSSAITKYIEDLNPNTTEQQRRDLAVRIIQQSEAVCQQPFSDYANYLYFQITSIVCGDTMDEIRSKENKKNKKKKNRKKRSRKRKVVG